ncbi:MULTISPECIES: hypothetical protein [Mycobacteriaceae]|uniref:Uncharacterized protein n=1 Tax=Mycolicibacterium mucogenicum DSM 44124 TaxID=1226753 RepID=A0A8E4W378_MYCMU|nr:MULTISPECIES: hypothetical protein [Mycobacteriaceae]KAB7758942.1 hypothetical protein MMUC44124_10640 [Mycolicibacterium mucogenicum DSM 44124]QPG69796.1 hypothetical protein C1S78_001800 [Mycolicibacterium mucogenicum DSM 44124]
MASEKLNRTITLSLVALAATTGVTLATATPASAAPATCETGCDVGGVDTAPPPFLKLNAPFVKFWNMQKVNFPFLKFDNLQKWDNLQKVNVFQKFNVFQKITGAPTLSIGNPFQK